MATTLSKLTSGAGGKTTESRTSGAGIAAGVLDSKTISLAIGTFESTIADFRMSSMVGIYGPAKGFSALGSSIGRSSLSSSKLSSSSRSEWISSSSASIKGADGVGINSKTFSSGSSFLLKPSPVIRSASDKSLPPVGAWTFSALCSGLILVPGWGLCLLLGAVKIGSAALLGFSSSTGLILSSCLLGLGRATLLTCPELALEGLNSGAADIFGAGLSSDLFSFCFCCAGDS